MKRRMILGVVVLVVAGAIAGGMRWSAARQALAEPLGYSSPINGGCYIAAPNVCKIHIDPFTINIANELGAKLVRFTLHANPAGGIAGPIYDFRTDVSNPPAVDYSPSMVMQDFAARCGETYYVNLIAQDTVDANPLNYGVTAAFTCPAGVP
jgi:hypothetical protein